MLLALGLVNFVKYCFPFQRTVMYLYDEVPLSRMEIVGKLLRFACPCGDSFELDIEEFLRGCDIAQCPTCSLQIKVVCTEDERARFASGQASAAVQQISVIA